MQLVAVLADRRAGNATGVGGWRRLDRSPDDDVDLVWVDEPGAFRHHPFRAADADGNDGHSGPQGDVDGAVEQRLHGRSGLALALGVQHERLTRLEHCDAAAKCLPVGGAARDREAAERRQQPSRQAVLPQRVLAHEAETATGQARRDRGVDVRAMNRGENECTVLRQVFAALDRQPRQGPRRCRRRWRARRSRRPG